MSTLTTDTHELRAFADAMHRAPAAAADAVAVAAYEASEIMASFLRESAPEFQGDLRSSIQPGSSVRASLTSLSAESEVTAGVPYALIQDVGRRPGRMPPEAPIRRWVQLKADRTGSPLTERELRSATFLIRRHIGRHGTRPTRYIDRGLQGAAPHVDSRMAKLEDELVRILERTT